MSVLSRVVGRSLVSIFSVEDLQAHCYCPSASSRIQSSVAGFLRKTSSSQVSFALFENFAKTQQEVMSFAALFSASMLRPPRRDSFANISLVTASNEEAVLLLGELAFESTSLGTEASNSSNDDSKLEKSDNQQCKAFPEDITVLGVLIPGFKELSNNNRENSRIQLLRNGHGIRRLKIPFGYEINIYIATLYTSSPIYTEDNFIAYLSQRENERQGGGNFVLEFTFLRDVTSSQMSVAWNYQLDTSVTHYYEGYKDDRDAFLRMLEGPMMERGTVLLEYEAGKGLQIKNQGNLVGCIPNEDFARAFVSMFMGDKPVTQELKTGLLQGPSQPSSNAGFPKERATDNYSKAGTIRTQA